MSKVTLTKAQADALESLRPNHDNVDIIETYAGSKFYVGARSLCEISLDTLIRALYIGYDTEKTAEERLRDEYDYRRVHEALSGRGFANGIKFTLDTLGVKIDGINA